MLIATIVQPCSFFFNLLLNQWLLMSIWAADSVSVSLSPLLELKRTSQLSLIYWTVFCWNRQLSKRSIDESNYNNEWLVNQHRNRILLLNGISEEKNMTNFYFHTINSFPWNAIQFLVQLNKMSIVAQFTARESL